MTSARSESTALPTSGGDGGGTSEGLLVSSAGIGVHRMGNVADPWPVVGSHGWGGSHRTFIPLLPYLPGGRGMVCPDLPGYGMSSEPSRWEWELVAALTLEALDLADVPRGVAAVGSCSGAILLLEIERLDPGRFGRLVLVDPFAWMPWYFRIFTLPFIGPLAYWTAFANPIGRWMGNRALARHRAEQTHLTASFSEQRHASTLAWLRMLRDLEGPRRFAGTRCEVVIVHGERTFGAVREGVPAWEAGLSLVRSVELAGAGHLPIEECSEAVSTLVWDDAPRWALAERSGTGA